MRVLDTKGRRGKKKGKFSKRNKNMFCEQFYFWISTQKNSGGTLNRYLDAPRHLSAIHNSQKVEATHARLPPHGFADRLCGILFSFKKEGHSGSLNNTDGPWRRDAKWDKPDTKDTYCMAPCSSDTNAIWRKLIETQSRIERRGARALWGQNLSWKA